MELEGLTFRIRRRFRADKHAQAVVKKMGQGGLIEPLVAGVELGEDDNQDFHTTNGTMSSARTNHDARARMYGNSLFLQF